MTMHPLRPRLHDHRLRRRRRFLVNLVSSPLRHRPDFLLIGEMKCGTSSLFSYLLEHPRFVPPTRKEIHYFSVAYHKGPRWYRAHFPIHRGHGGVTGEACPDYLYSPLAGDRIRRALPGARLIVLLREPVERTLSHYFHELRWGREYLPVMEALEAEEERLEDADPTTPDGLEVHLHASYKRRSCYADRLERYLELFPRSQMLILGSNLLFRRPDLALEKTLRFIGLSPIDVPAERFEVRNRGNNRKPVPTEVYDYLNAYFEAPNRRLERLLGGPVDW